MHKIVEVTVDGVPTGTENAAVLTETEVDLQRSPGCGLRGFVDGGTGEPEAPASNQQPKNKQQRWHEQGQFDRSGSSLVPY